MPGATSSVLATSSDAPCLYGSTQADIEAQWSVAYFDIVDREQARLWAGLPFSQTL